MPQPKLPQPIYLDEATVLPPLESEIQRSRPLIPWRQRLGGGDSCVDPLTDTAQLQCIRLAFVLWCVLSRYESSRSKKCKDADGIRILRTIDVDRQDSES